MRSATSDEVLAALLFLLNHFSYYPPVCLIFILYFIRLTFNENGKKEGFNDIQCLIEARLEGLKPVAVKAQGNNVELAVSSAIEKMKASLETIIGKKQNH